MRALSCCVALAVAVVLAGGSAGASPAPSGKLIFTGHYIRDHDDEWVSAVFTVRPDGSGLRRVSPWQDGPRSGVLSRSGRRIAFATDRGVVISDATGANRRRVSSANAVGVTWSPDDRRVAFTDLDDDHRIRIAGVDGRGRRNVSTQNVIAKEVAWSPDGSTLAFVGIEDGAYEIYRIGADGEGLRKLTQTRGGASRPAWSPDGRHLVYSVLSGGGVWTVRSDGTSARRIRAGWDWGPSAAWSPDGRQIAIGSNLLSNSPRRITFVTPGGRLLRTIRIDGRIIRATPNGPLRQIHGLGGVGWSR
jgi:Tol biopolymer transport system component